MFKIDIYTFLRIGDILPCESSNYIDIYSINKSNVIKTNIRLAIIYPHDEVFLNVESRIYKLNRNQSTNHNPCDSGESNFTRIEMTRPQTTSQSVLCLAINISDIVGLMSKYRKRIYRAHVSDSDTISYIVSAGYFASANI